MPDKQGRYKPGVPTQINSMKNVEPFGEFRWVPAGEGCVRTLMTRAYYHRARRHPEGLDWQVNPRWDRNRQWYVNGVGDGQWTDGAKEALDHFWPLMKSEAPKDEPIAWQFKATPDKVDIARCLREAYDAGAREVTITHWNNVDVHYLHVSEQPLVQRYLESQGIDIRFMKTSRPEWTSYSRSWLAKARAWEAEQKAKAETKIVVKVKGVR